ncbi:MAG: stage III sporulation protein AB [Oscillospiraceae bacterium]|nr:stage III sporulation protein AB [Oscillospiraceae bacterium]
MDKRLQTVPELFPEPMRQAVKKLLEERGGRVEELRFRTGFPASWRMAGRELSLGGQNLPRVTPELLEEIVRRASGNAAYAVQEQLRRGYLTLSGGHRLGLCGTASVENGTIKTVRCYQSLAVRLAGERNGCADALALHIQNHPASTLILGPPGAGKTTVLRDLIRQSSDRFGQRVGVVDERGELAACRNGVPQLNVGQHTDVLTGFPKAAGIEQLVRTMAPQWIALDEITASADISCMEQAAYCGVRFLATAHAASFAELTARPLYRQLLKTRVFENLALILPDRSIAWERMNDGLLQNSRGGTDPGGVPLGRLSCCLASAADA